MNHSMTMVYILTLIPGIICIILGFIFRASGASNGIGYKNDVTRSSSEARQEANNLAGRILIIEGVANLILWPFIAHLFWDGYMSLVILSWGLVSVLTLNFVVGFTEAYLRRTFDSHGNRRPNSEQYKML